LLIQTAAEAPEPNGQDEPQGNLTAEEIRQQQMQAEMKEAMAAWDDSKFAEDDL
jgi:hypothetical protein